MAALSSSTTTPSSLLADFSFPGAFPYAFGRWNVDAPHEPPHHRVAPDERPGRVLLDRSLAVEQDAAFAAFVAEHGDDQAINEVEPLHTRANARAMAAPSSSTTTPSSLLADFSFPGAFPYAFGRWNVDAPREPPHHRVAPDERPVRVRVLLDRSLAVEQDAAFAAFVAEHGGDQAINEVERTATAVDFVGWTACRVVREMARVLDRIHAPATLPRAEPGVVDDLAWRPAESPAASVRMLDLALRRGEEVVAVITTLVPTASEAGGAFNRLMKCLELGTVDLADLEAAGSDVYQLAIEASSAMSHFKASWCFFLDCQHLIVGKRVQGAGTAGFDLVLSPPVPFDGNSPSAARLLLSTLYDELAPQSRPREVGHDSRSGSSPPLGASFAAAAAAESGADRADRNPPGRLPDGDAREQPAPQVPREGDAVLLLYPDGCSDSDYVCQAPPEAPAVASSSASSLKISVQEGAGTATSAPPSPILVQPSPKQECSPLRQVQLQLHSILGHGATSVAYGGSFGDDGDGDADAADPALVVKVPVASDAAADLQNEATFLHMLADAPVVVPLVAFAVGRNPRAPLLLVTEFGGQTLSSWSEMSETEQATFYAQVQDLHRRGVYHGDIEPRNVVVSVVDGCRVVRIIDFAWMTMHECPGEVCEELVKLRTTFSGANSE
ncbi:hypothetical protein JCM10450v2_006774 [Rhodotorula kratochvilovae]